LCDISDIIYDRCKGKIRINANRNNGEYVQNYIVREASALSYMFNAAPRTVESWEDERGRRNEKGAKTIFCTEPSEYHSNPMLDLALLQMVWG
jgi:hypothetical protein